jgi:hypothetical protein
MTDTTKPNARPSQARYRLMVAGRTLLAIFGGYALAAITTAFLSLTLPLDRSEAVAAATLASFAIMAAAVIWVFSARTLARAAIGLALPALCLGAGLWLALGSAVQPA